MKLWEKGIATSKTVEAFTVADDRTYDVALAPYDVQASMAHAKMLGAQGIIASAEADALVKALEAYGEEVSRDGFVIEEEYEDIHSKIEAHLIEKLGDVGKKIHTARSRNDQVLVALQLYSVDQLENIAVKTHAFAQILLGLAEQNKEAFMPGYTHMQVAMPSSFGLWFSAYAETLADDIVGLKTAQHLANQNPLGSAAGYGSSFDIDRDAVTRELNFGATKVNAIAAQMMRGRNERRVVGALGELAVTLSKLAGDICMYMGQDFGFFSFPDHITTGSSIMPHKKNPDVFELLRANANSFQASQLELSMILTNLSTGYHRDLQLTKPLLMDGFAKMNELLDVFIQVLPEIKVNDSLADLEKYDYLYSVDTLNQWVSDGMPFREAYRKMAEDIANGVYSPNKNVLHKHLGSKGNLGLDRIGAKLDAALKTGRLT